MPYDSVHPDYALNLPEWQMLRDCSAGERAIKRRGTTYLPRPAGRTDDDYRAYQERAVFFDATHKTVAAMVGAIFRKSPVAVLPSEIAYLEDNADGRGSTLSQLSKRAAEEVVTIGRCGLLVDFPPIEGDLRLDEERALQAAARISMYPAESIVNWRYSQVGSIMRLSLVVLREEVTEPSEGDRFSVTPVTYHRILELDEAGLYRVTVMREGSEDPVAMYEPRIASGQRMSEIPFVFIGATDNDGAVDKSPVYDIARVNLAHYRNTADFEDALFLCGQPTPFITGLTQEFIAQFGGQMMIGSRAAWLLPENTTVGMLESQTNLGAMREAISLKENQMVALGARLIGAVTSGAEAAETLRLRASGEANVMASISENLRIAMEAAMAWCSIWQGGKGAVEFTMNDDFFAERLSGQDIAELIKAWQAGAITYGTLFEQLLKGEVIASGTDLEQYEDALEEAAPQMEIAIDPADDEDEDEDEDEEQDEGEEPRPDSEA